MIDVLGKILPRDRLTALLVQQPCSVIGDDQTEDPLRVDLNSRAVLTAATAVVVTAAAQAESAKSAKSPATDLRDPQVWSREHESDEEQYQRCARHGVSP